MYSRISTVGEEEEVGNKFGLVLWAKIQDKPLEPPIDKQKLQKSPQEAKGVPRLFRALKLYVMTRMTGENKNTSCGLFLWHLWTQSLASLPFGNELAIIWRLAYFQQLQGISVLQGTIFWFCWDRGKNLSFCMWDSPCPHLGLTFVSWRPTTGEAEMEKIAEYLRTNGRKTTDRNTSFSLSAEDTLGSRT